MNRIEHANTFTVLDWIGIVYVVGSILGLFVFPKIALIFNKMFMDFGGVLPTLTEVVLKPWFSIVLGLICLCIFSMQWLPAIKGNINRKRAVIILSFLAISAALAICMIGLYLPIFKMAGSV